MEPKTLSASGLQTYMDCPARFKAEYIDRIRISSGGGSAGDLGSLIHETLEWFVDQGRFITTGSKPLGDKCRELAPKYGVDATQIKVAVKMIFAWYDRWTLMVDDPNKPFEVLMAEVKETFPLKVKDSSGQPREVPVTYIWDRVDRMMNDGSIRVVDYKSWMKYLSADEVYTSLQVRLYALAAAIRYKDDGPPFIWVQLDQLRYDGGAVTVRFTRDDIRDIYNWLKATYVQLLDDDGTQENVGNGCRFCVRSTSCASFQRAVSAGTIMSYTDPEDAARKVAEINSITGALMDTKAQLLAYLETYLEERGYLEERWESGITLKITPKRNRTVNHQAVVDAVGQEIASRYGKLGVTVIDELLAGDELSDEQKAALRKAVDEGVTTSVNAVFK